MAGPQARGDYQIEQEVTTTNQATTHVRCELLPPSSALRQSRGDLEKQQLAENSGTRQNLLGAIVVKAILFLRRIESDTEVGC